MYKLPERRGGGGGNSGNARKKTFFLREGFPYPVDGAGALCQYIILSLNMSVILKKNKGIECFIFNQRCLWLCFQIDSNEKKKFSKQSHPCKFINFLRGWGHWKYL